MIHFKSLVFPNSNFNDSFLISGETSINLIIFI